MKKWISRTLLSVVIIVALVCGMVYYVRYRPVAPLMKNWETETNIPVIGRNQSYDLLFLGTSHGRIFSRFHNHERVEKILGKSLINLSQGADHGGIYSQHIFLSYFYFRRNTAKTVVYFVDPFFFFRKSLDQGSHIFDNEPLRNDFLKLLKDEGANPDAIKRYSVNTYEPTSPSEFDMYFTNRQDAAMESVQDDQINGRAQFLYGEGYDKEWFDTVFDKFIRTIKEAQEHKARVIVILPTTLIPEQKDDHYVYEALQSASKQYDFELYDFSHAITDTRLYYDVDHLNTKGVETFTTKYLRILFQK